MNRLNLLFIFCLIAGLYCLPEDSYAQASGSYESKIAEAYGTYTSQLSVDQLNWLNNCLGRCTVSETAYAEGETIKNLSSVSLNKKFVSTLAYDDTYDAATFNPLKYNINFFDKKDQYFRIFNTGYVLKVKRKE